MNKTEYIKKKKEQFENGLKSAFDENKLYVIVFADANQSSCCGCHEYCDMYSGCNNTWRDNIRNLLKGELKYYQTPVDKWITYRCNCGCDSFYCYRNWFVCSECFDEHLVGAFVRTEGNLWHRFGIVSKYEFDGFVKECKTEKIEKL